MSARTVSHSVSNNITVPSIGPAQVVVVNLQRLVTRTVFMLRLAACIAGTVWVRIITLSRAQVNIKCQEA